MFSFHTRAAVLEKLLLGFRAKEFGFLRQFRRAADVQTIMQFLPTFWGALAWFALTGFG